MLTKLTPQTAQNVRDLSASTFRVFLLRADSEIVAKIQNAGKAYHEAVKKDGAGHNLGPPSVHQWSAAVQHAIEAAVDGTHKETLKQYWSDYVIKVPPAVISETVGCFRLRKTHNKDQVRLILSIRDSNVEDAFVRILQSLGGTLRTGAAPPGELERVAQMMLEERS